MSTVGPLILIVPIATGALQFILSKMMIPSKVGVAVLEKDIQKTKCLMQQCALPDSVELQVFLEVHACNGVQHVAWAALDQICRERMAFLDTVTSAVRH